MDSLSYSNAKEGSAEKFAIHSSLIIPGYKNTVFANKHDKGTYVNHGSILLAIIWNSIDYMDWF